MTKKLTSLLAIILLANTLNAQVEPNAGNWKTWFISSGKDFRLPAPASTKNEIAEVLAVQQKLDLQGKKNIEFWNAGSPSYRWQDLISKIWQSDAMQNGILANMLVSVTTYDATIAAWDSKYAYNRIRPYASDKRIKTFGLKPESPSYPCEYSVAAGVASTIIAHYFPKMADSVNRMAKQVMESRIAAGVAFPSDTKAGFELGKRIAEKEIEVTKGYLNNNPWDGKLPEGKGLWNGKFALFANAGKSKTIVLTSANQFRPGPPPDFTKEMEELKNYKHTHKAMANAFFYDSQKFWEDVLAKKMFEYNLQLNPPQAARIYAAAAIGYYDGFVSCFDAKYTYWGIRPEQYDTTFKPVLLESPPFPGYPSGHAAVSSVTAEIYSYFFPKDRIYFQMKAKEVAESRFQGGIHFRTDNEVALELGKKVAAEIVKKLKVDGAD
jgi:PAP2 superfamily